MRHDDARNIVVVTITIFPLVHLHPLPGGTVSQDKPLERHQLPRPGNRLLHLQSRKKGNDGNQTDNEETLVENKGTIFNIYTRSSNVIRMDPIRIMTLHAGVNKRYECVNKRYQSVNRNY